jgi:Family of unknown function (DUF6510)
MNAMPETSRLDGNAVAGLMLEIFGREMTLANGVCRSCGVQSLLAELHVYSRAPGTVVRCRACGAMLICVVQAPGRTWIDLGGLATLELPE